MGLEEYWSVRIIAITAVVFILQMAFPWITESFALNSAEALGKPWEFITHIFLHGGFEHIFYNMFALGLFGIILEKIIGGKRFLLIYFIGGVIAGIAALFYPSAIGASGAVFAIMGTLAMLRPKLTVFIFGIPMPMIIASALWIAIDIFGVLFPAGTANTAHLAGLFFGFVVGFALRKRFGELLFSEKGKQSFTDREFNRWENRWMR